MGRGAGHDPSRPIEWELTMFTGKFWKAAAERAAKSAGQALIGLWVGDGVFNLWSVDAAAAAGVAAGAAVLSVLTSIVSTPFGEGNSPSAVSNP
jgi:hypothetical protein